MRLLTTILVIMICSFYARAQDQTEIASDTTKSEQTEFSKLELKVKELENEVEEAMAAREKLREEAHASTEPEAYSKVATASVKITKLQEKLYYAQKKLVTAQQREQKKKAKAAKKKGA
ncbi:MAG: hypothetical protein OER04_17175 [Cyclobacteriaceae bacterium]|nr:hypothetical protein [Cyclobacteriaceae bacterium]